MKKWIDIAEVPERCCWYWDGSDECYSINLETESGLLLGWIQHWDADNPEDEWYGKPWRVTGWRLRGDIDEHFATFQEAADFLQSNTEYDKVPVHAQEVMDFFRGDRS